MLSFARGLSAPSLIWFFLSIHARSLHEKEGGQQADGRTASSIARAGVWRGREQKGGLKEVGKLVTEGRASRCCVGVFFVHTGDCSVSVCLSPGCSCSYYIWSFYTIQHCLWGMCCLQLIGKCPPLHPAVTLTISSPDCSAAPGDSLLFLNGKADPDSTISEEVVLSSCQRVVFCFSGSGTHTELL